jgi:hypothetical protein
MFDIKKEKEANNIKNNQTSALPKKKSFFDMLFGKKEPFNNYAPPKLDINSYKDTEGLTVSKMNFGLWLVEHRKQLLLVPLIFLIAVSAITWAYTIFGLSYYVIWGMKADDKLGAELANQVLTINRNIIPLQIEPVEIIANEDNKYDFLIKIKNNNKKYWAYLQYYFKTGDLNTNEENNYIMPNEEKYLMSLNNEFTGLPANIEFFIKNVSWQLINPHKYPDWEKFKNEHLDIKVTDAKFIPAKSTILAEKLNLNDLQFIASNNSAYNYYGVDFTILLIGQSRVIGANKYKLNNFYSGESRQINITWPGRLGRIDDIVITPGVDLLKDDIYIKYEGNINSGGL